jgi:putative copper resistance protein D
MSGIELARWALYVDLGVLFGLPAAAMLVKAGAQLKSLRPLLVVPAILSLPLSAVGFLLLVAQMAGTGVGDVDQSLVLDLLTGSALGWAAIVRLAALTGAVALLASPRPNPSWVLASAAIAVATLAWSGHAASSEGALGILRLLGDVVHLLAASIWLGALILFLAMLLTRQIQPDTATALERFSGIGSVLVAVLLGTGVGNLLFLAVPSQWAALANGGYGRLLLVKLALFAAMLGLAATNRFLLVPRLRTRGGSSPGLGGVRHLRLSIFVELALGIGVLLLVAILGLLDPGVG